MMNGPLVSIIIPVFNAEKTLAKSLESVIHQDYLNKEIIVIDGLSSDRSFEIAEHYHNQISYYIREKDNGVYDAMNKGISLATGDWIYILGADDILASPSVLSTVFQNRNHVCKIIFGSVKNLGASNKLVPKDHISSFSSKLYWKNTLHQQSVFYSKSLFNAFRFNVNYRILADYDFHLLLLNEKTSFEKVDLIVAYCEAQGLSKKFNRALYEEELTVKKTRLNIFLWIANIPLVLLKYLLKKIS